MRFKMPEIPPPQLLASLRAFNLLPAIVFLPTRRRCDESAMEVALKRDSADPEREAERKRIFDECVIDTPEIARHKHKNILVRAGIAAHHAGHIPSWKLLVEKMMSAGLLDAIFATSTVAAGVDFPARTVVLSFADTRGNDGWRAFQASELQQMTGRAGRRGKDQVGFVVLAPSNFQNPPKIAQLLKMPPDPLQSQFRATYSSLLNLLDAYRSFHEVRMIAEKSFAFRHTARRILELEAQRAKRFQTITKRFDVTDLNLNFRDALGFYHLTNARTRLEERLPITRAEVRHKWLAENVVTGRVVVHGRGGKRFFLVLNVHGEKVLAMKEDGNGTNFALDRVIRVYDKKYALKDESIEQAFLDTYGGTNPPIEEPKIKFERSDNHEAIDVLTGLLEKILPEELSATDRSRAGTILWESVNDADVWSKIGRDIDFLRDEIWLPFENRAHVLHYLGYLDFPRELVTDSGKWLADLRVDRPLLVGEALGSGLFEGLEIKHVAGLMGALAGDSDRNYGELYLSDRLLEIIGKFEESVFEISNIEWKFGVEPAPEMNFSAAAAAEAWANGMSWELLVSRTKAEEGDLVRLLSRTGEALLQISNLRKSNPGAAEKARQTAEVILREPIR